jgi:predicted glycosyltransferase
MSRKRVLIYSHDTFGIGNIRRTMELSKAMSRRLPDLSILLLTGSAIADAFEIPSNVDYVKLPAIRREGRQDYRARAEGFNFEHVRKMRVEICRSAVECFSPDMVIVDKAPFGVDGELAPALASLREQRPDCVRILALRDILDLGEVVSEEWARKCVGQAIARHYDSVWVFGSPSLFDVAREYRLPPEVTDKLRYVGWMQRNASPRDPADVRSSLGLDDAPILLVTAGGGDDGDLLLSTFGRIIDELDHVEPKLATVIVSGPQAKPELRGSLAKICAGRPRRRFCEFTSDFLSLMNAASGVLSMGGYNTICEILWLGKPALIVPRTHPVQEQLVRAERLAALGAVRMCRPEELSPSRLLTETRIILREFVPSLLDPICFPFDALERASAAAASLLGCSALESAAGDSMTVRTRKPCPSSFMR